MKDHPKSAAVDTQQVMLEMLGLLGRAIVVGVAVSAAAAGSIVLLVMAAS